MLSSVASTRFSLVISFTGEQIDNLQPTQWPWKNSFPWKLPNSAVTIDLQPRPYLKVQDISESLLVPVQSLIGHPTSSFRYLR